MLDSNFAGQGDPDRRIRETMGPPPRELRVSRRSHGVLEACNLTSIFLEGKRTGKRNTLLIPMPG
jgi:hypothetical protein